MLNNRYCDSVYVLCMQVFLVQCLCAGWWTEAVQSHHRHTVCLHGNLIVSLCLCLFHLSHDCAGIWTEAVQSHHRHTVCLHGKISDCQLVSLSFPFVPWLCRNMNWSCTEPPQAHSVFTWKNLWLSACVSVSSICPMTVQEYELKLYRATTGTQCVYMVKSLIVSLCLCLFHLAHDCAGMWTEVVHRHTVYSHGNLWLSTCVSACVSVLPMCPMTVCRSMNWSCTEPQAHSLSTWRG